MEDNYKKLLEFVKQYEKYDAEIRRKGYTKITKFDVMHDYYVANIKPLIEESE